MSFWQLKRLHQFGRKVLSAQALTFVPCLSCQNSTTASSFVAALLYLCVLLLERLLNRAVAHCWRYSTLFRPLWKNCFPIGRSRHVRGNMATLTLMITLSAEEIWNCRLPGLTSIDVLCGDHARHWDRVARRKCQCPQNVSQTVSQKTSVKVHCTLHATHKGQLCPAGERST